MSSEVLGGVVGAWSVTHAALGIYFLLAYLLGRREREHLLFGLLCFTFSLSSFGEALDYVSSTSDAYHRSDVINHAGYIAGSALNLHFALAFARVQRRGRIAFLLYVAAAAFLAADFSDRFWIDRHTATTFLLGEQVHYSVGEPSRLCYTFYAVGALETVASAGLLFR